MARFSTVTPINIADTAFKHNGKSFQTSDLPIGDNVNNDYLVFNGQLYIEYEDGVKHDMAKPFDYTGTVSIYNSFTDSWYETWVEYELRFENGQLKSVVAVTNKITKDLRDANEKRPRPSSPSVVITLSDSEEVYNQFHADLNNKLNAIRDIIGEPKATISFPQKSTGTNIFSSGAGLTRHVLSVVQTMDDFAPAGEIAGKKAIVSTVENDGVSLMLMDEFHFHCKQ